MSRAAPSSTRSSAAGVVDTLTAGYVLVNRRLWVLLVPIVLNAALWFGPQVSLSPLLDPAFLRAAEWARGLPIEAAAPPGTSRQSFVTDLDRLRLSLSSAASEINALSLLTTGPLEVPTVRGGLPGGNGSFVFAFGWSQALALLGGSLVGGLLAGALFRVVLADAVRTSERGWRAGLRFLPSAILRVLALAATVLAATLFFGIPALGLAAFVGVLAPIVGTLGLAGIVFGALFAWVHLYFAVDAIFVRHVGPLAAIQQSVGVVRRALFPALGLITLTIVIQAGMERVWVLLDDTLQTPLGVALSVLANSYIASGLTAAGMIFFQQRVDQLAPMPAISSAAPTPAAPSGHV